MEELPRRDRQAVEMAKPLLDFLEEREVTAYLRGLFDARAPVRRSAQIGADLTNGPRVQKAKRRRKSWQQEAEKIWADRPDLSVRSVAVRIERRFQFYP